MEAKRTVFVVGAGASAEANLPTGDRLKDEIAAVLDIRFDTFGRQFQGDESVLDALKLEHKDLSSPTAKGKDLVAYVQAAAMIAKNMPLVPSIDHFLDIHRDNKKIALCGKLAIVRCILGAEKNSPLFVDPLQLDQPLDIKKTRNTWFNRFFQLLSQQCGKSDIAQRLSTITLVIFNYDRCIEHFLVHAFQSCYGITEAEAAAILQHLEIYHPYGIVGSLPWQKKSGEARPIRFGIELGSRDLLEYSKGIKTFTEGTDPQVSDIVQIRQRLQEAETVIFLGFAFHRLNMDLIAPGKQHAASLTKLLLGTAYEKSMSDRAEIIEDLKKRFGVREERVSLTGNKCFSFFDELSHTLSLATLPRS